MSVPVEDTVEDEGEGVEGEDEVDLSDAASSIFSGIISSRSAGGALAGSSPSFSRFFCFILRFWNQIFT